MSCENLDFPAAYPWAACAPKPAQILPSDYTGCECHDACDEAWFKAHIEAIATAMLQKHPESLQKAAKGP